MMQSPFLWPLIGQYENGCRGIFNGDVEYTNRLYIVSRVKYIVNFSIYTL